MDCQRRFPGKNHRRASEALSTFRCLETVLLQRQLFDQSRNLFEPGGDADPRDFKKVGDCSDESSVQADFAAQSDGPGITPSVPRVMLPA